jgi:hypothetical protein
MARPLRPNASPVIARSGSEEASSLLAALLDCFAGACHRAGHFGPDPFGLAMTSA